MFEDEIYQLEIEIRRHYAMASITGGIIRADHLAAARKLGTILEQIGGAEPRQKSKSESRTALHPLRFWGRSRAKSRAKKSRGC